MTTPFRALPRLDVGLVAFAIAYFFVWEPFKRSDHIFAKAELLHFSVVLGFFFVCVCSLRRCVKCSKPLVRNFFAGIFLPENAIEWRKQLTQIVYEKAYASNSLVSLWIMLVVSLFSWVIPRPVFSFERPAHTIFDGVDEDTRLQILGDSAGEHTIDALSAGSFSAAGGGTTWYDTPVELTLRACVFATAICVCLGYEAVFAQLLRVPAWVQIIGGGIFFSFKPHLLIYSGALLFLVYTDVVSRVMDATKWMKSSSVRWACQRLLEYATGVSYVIAGLDEAGYTLSDLIFDDFYIMVTVLICLLLFGHAIMFASVWLTERVAIWEREASESTARARPAPPTGFAYTFIYQYSIEWRIALALVWSTWSVVAGRALALLIIELKPLTGASSERGALALWGPRAMSILFMCFYSFFLYFVFLYWRVGHSVFNKTQILKCKPDLSSLQFDTEGGRELKWELGPLGESIKSFDIVKKSALVVKTFSQRLKRENRGGETEKWRLYLMFTKFFTEICKNLDKFGENLRSLKTQRAIYADRKPWTVEFYVKVHIANTAQKAVEWEEMEIDLTCDGGSGANGMSDAQWCDLEFDARDAEQARGRAGRHGKALMATVRFTKVRSLACTAARFGARACFIPCAPGRLLTLPSRPRFHAPLLVGGAQDEGRGVDGGAAASAEHSARASEKETRAPRSWTLKPNSNDEHCITVCITVPHAAKRRWISLTQALFADADASEPLRGANGKNGRAASAVPQTSGGTVWAKLLNQAINVGQHAAKLVDGAMNLRSALTAMRSHTTSLSDRVGTNFERIYPCFDIAVALKLDNGGYDSIPETWLPHVSLPVVVDNRWGFAEEPDDASASGAGAVGSTTGTMFAPAHGLSEDEVQVEETFKDFFCKLDEDGKGGEEGRASAANALKALLKEIEGGASPVMIIDNVVELFLRVTTAGSGDASRLEMCDFVTEMTLSYFLFQLLEAVKDAFAFHTFRRTLKKGDGKMDAVTDRWKHIERDVRMKNFRGNKGWNELWYGRLKGGLLVLWQAELAVGTRVVVKRHVRELYSAVREKITPTVEGWLRKNDIDTDVQYADGSNVVGDLERIFTKLGVRDYDDLWRIEIADLELEGVTQLWASEKVFAQRQKRKPKFSTQVLNATSWLELLKALGLSGRDTGIAGASSSSSRELAKIDYKTLKRRADKLTRPDDASPGWNSEVVVLMAVPYRLSLVRARELAAAAAEIPALSHRRKDPISEAASAQGLDPQRNKSDFLRALSLFEFKGQIGFTAQNALILMTDYT